MSECRAKPGVSADMPGSSNPLLTLVRSCACSLVRPQAWEEACASISCPSADGLPATRSCPATPVPRLGTARSSVAALVATVAEITVGLLSCPPWGGWPDM